MSLCRIVLVTEEKVFADRWVMELKQAASTDESAPLKVLFSSAQLHQLDELLCQAHVQLIVLDEKSLVARGVAEIARAVRSKRAEIDMFLLASDKIPRVASEYDGVLARSEYNYGVVYRTLRRALIARLATPFADALKAYVFAAKDSWHTPGHSSGDSLSSSPWVADFYRFMGEHMFNTDLSVSVKMLDSLMDPVSVIRQSQQLAAKAFGARHSYFITNGTSTSNKIVLQYLTRHGDEVIVDRNCHKSVHHAMIMSGSIPVYLDASVNQHYGIYGPVPKTDIFAAIDRHSKARLLVLTSCTYDGLRYDLKPIVDYAHSKGVKVLIDEAWYAHARFHPEFRPTALECGADFVTHSTHKMLSAFSQASMIHVGHSVEDFDAPRLREDINMHTSTSPQYGMIASLDVARKQMSIEGYGVLERTLGFAAEIRDFVAQATRFMCLRAEQLCDTAVANDGIKLDPTKVTIDVGMAGLSAPRAQAILFNEFGIQVEKNTHNTITLLVTIGTTESKVLRLKQALQALSSRIDVSQTLSASNQCLPALSQLVVLPRSAYFCTGEKVALDNADIGALVGRVACDEIVPYPPGIPLVVPGQQLTHELLESIHDFVFLREDLEVHGVHEYKNLASIRVMTLDEQDLGETELNQLRARMYG